MQMKYLSFQKICKKTADLNMKEDSMANLDDITGWREEITAFKETEEGKDFFREREEREDGRSYPRPRPKVPLSAILRLMELYRSHEEPNAAMEAYVSYQSYIDELCDYHTEISKKATEYIDIEELSLPGRPRPKYPDDAMETIKLFGQWYAMNQGLTYARYLYRSIQYSCYELAITEDKEESMREAIEWFVVRKQSEVLDDRESGHE